MKCLECNSKKSSQLHKSHADKKNPAYFFDYADLQKKVAAITYIDFEERAQIQ